MNTAGYKTGTKMALPKAPFTPVNAPGPNGAYQNPNQTQNHSTQQQAGGGNQRQHMYMSQPQVATVLSHQQPPPPPGQGAQSGQSSAPSRGVPPPPPQPAQTGFNPQQGFVPAADNMHGYAQGRSMPFAAAAAGPSHFYSGYYLSNQGHPAMSYDSAQQAYLAQNAQAMFPPPPAPFIYQQWVPHMRAQNPPSAPQAAPSSAQSAQPAPAEPLVYPGASLIPPIQQPMQYAYQPGYAAANPSQPPAQASQPYQKREKKPLLIVDPNTKKPINQQEQQQQTQTQQQPQQPSVAQSKPDASSSVVVETSKKENIANIVEDKKNVDTSHISERSGEDFQTQMIRKMKDQQQQQQSGSGPAGVVAEESVSVASKPSSKQVTVSVSQAHAPVPAAAVAEPEPKIEPVKTEEESGAAKQEQQQQQQEPEKEKEEESKAEAEPQKKRRYDREFLMSLKDSELSKQIPEHLKELDVFKDLRVKPGQQYFGKSSYGGGGGGGQEQQYGKGSMSKNKSQKFGSMNKYHRGSMEGGRQQAADMDMPRPQPIKKAATEHEELLRDVRNILNKLTPQNLQKLTGDLLNLPINTEDRLKDSIHVIFEKSLDEQVFSQTYAELCKQMCRITVPIESDTTKLVNFRTMLLTKCQQEFENDYVQNVNYETLIAEAEAQPDEAKRAELKELAAEKLTKAKRRSLGNIRFIGELFKLKMLTEGIMNDCIDRLLKQDTDEENLECLCKLLTTIGKELDKANNAQRIKAYFDKLDKISKRKEAISARIRFMIMDVIDLRKNEWVPRRKDTGPRKIDDIRREAQEEKARLEAAQQQQQMQQQAHGRQKGGKYVAKSTSMGSSSAGKAHNGSMASKIKDVRQITNRNSNELTLGPGGSSSYSWGKQSRAAAVAAPSAAAAAAAEHNIPQSASFSAQKRVAEPVARASLDSRAVKDRLQAVKRMDSASDTSQPSSRDSSLSRPLKKNYTDDEIDRKTNSFINELVQNKIMAESIKDLEEFCPLNTEQYADFVEKCIMVTLEKNHTWRTLLGQFFYIALRDKKLDHNRFEQGLKRVVEMSEDMSIDIPKISTYLGQIIAPLFNENFSMSFLKQALEPVLEIKISAEIVTEALTLASERLGHSTVSGIFKASNLQLDDFLRGVDQKQHFISENKLDWLNDPNCDKPQSNTSVESYETILNQILPSVEEDTGIFGMIEAKFQDCRSKMFIRALVIAVCNSCYNGKFDSDLFKTQCFILRRYIGENEDLEFEALFAVQALDHRLQHQPGFIRVIFDLLYDEDLIREDVFLKWKNEGREEGHAISVLALKQFFEWLADPENENQEGANENR